MVCITLPCILCPSNGVFLDLDRKRSLSKMKGTSLSKMMRSAGAPGVIRPLGKPNKVAGFKVRL